MRGLGLGSAVVQALINHLPKHPVVFAQVIAGCGLNVLMPGQILYMRNVSPMVQEVCAECMSENVRGKFLGNPRLPSQQNEEPGDVFPRPSSNRITRSYKQPGIFVVPLT